MNQYPKMFHLTQTFARPLVADLAGTIRAELDQLGIKGKIQPGQKIGITAGSRGVQNILTILRTTIDYVREAGGQPHLLAAMGSHGGGTEEGQKELLDSLGITEALGAPVLTCADCRVVGATAGGLPVHTLATALAMDGILVINRVKTHTSFKGYVESGLTKIMVVGLGGPKGARQFHGFGAEELPRLLQEIGTVLLGKLPVLGALAVIENAYEETAMIAGVAPDGLIKREAELLEYSKTLLPALPVDQVDLLIVQELGKNFSGTGMDTNIIGRIRIEGVPEPALPAVKRVAVLDLSEASHGNASGIGLADFITQKIVDKIDKKITYLNCLTSTFVIRAAIPMYFDTEEQLLEAAAMSLGAIAPEQLRIIVIPNTLFLSECYVSEALASELRGRPGLSIHPEAQELAFDAAGNLALRIGH